MPVLDKTDMPQSNLISSVTQGQPPFVSLQAEAWVTQLQVRWELYFPGVSECCYWWAFLHVCERKERENGHRLTLETCSSGVPVMPERSAWLVNTSTIPIFLRVLFIS